VLDDGWYIVEVGPLELPMRWSNPASFTVNDDGTASSRFRIGSQPIVNGISICNKANGQTALVVSTSERVVVSDPLDRRVSVSTSQGTAQCVAIPATDVGSIEFVCNLPRCVAVTVSLNEAFSALNTPEAPAKGSSAEFTFDSATLPDQGGDCKISGHHCSNTPRSARHAATKQPRHGALVERGRIGYSRRIGGRDAARVNQSKHDPRPACTTSPSTSNAMSKLEN
jgi:hypothetical protein